MFINKTENGKNNRCGEQIAQLRMKEGWLQRQLADLFQVKYEVLLDNAEK